MLSRLLARESADTHCWGQPCLRQVLLSFLKNPKQAGNEFVTATTGVNLCWADEVKTHQHLSILCPSTVYGAVTCFLVFKTSKGCWMKVFMSSLPALFFSSAWLKAGHRQMNYKGIFIIKFRKLEENPKN